MWIDGLAFGPVHVYLHAWEQEQGLILYQWTPKLEPFVVPLPNPFKKKVPFPKSFPWVPRPQPQPGFTFGPLESSEFYAPAKAGVLR